MGRWRKRKDGTWVESQSRSRWDASVSFDAMYPTRTDGVCCCGCEEKLTGRKTRWASKECSRLAYEAYALLKGDVRLIRSAVWERDGGVCAHCGDTHDTAWEADHIVEWADGGTHALTNLQTLCLPCHKAKTKQSAAERRARKKKERIEAEMKEWVRQKRARNRRRK